MKICLAMIGRFEEREGAVYGDPKNISAITRYLKYADEILVVARRTKVAGLYERQAVDCRGGRIAFHLYDEKEGVADIFRAGRDYAKTLARCVARADLVLCWSQPTIAWIWREAAQNRKPFAVYVGGCGKDILFSYRSPLKRVAGWGILLMNRWAIRRADYVHYVTERVLQEKYPCQGKSIGATFARIETRMVPEVMKNRLERTRSNSSQTTLGMIGYLNPVKGVDTAIKALSTLDNSFRLRILGGGNQTWAKKLAVRFGVADRVFFDGTRLPGPSVFEWIDQIDIYIQPSRAEGLPRATIEAMSRGCPTVSSSAGGLCELIGDEYRHKVGDWRQLGRIVRRLASNPDEMASLSQRNHEFVQKYERGRMDAIIDRFFGEIAMDLGCSAEVKEDAK